MTDETPGLQLATINALERTAQSGSLIGTEDAFWLCSLARKSVQLERIRHAATGVLLCFEDWPKYTGSEYCQAEREHALELLRESYG